MQTQSKTNAKNHIDESAFERFVDTFESDMLVCGMDAARNNLIVPENRIFCEVNSNVWKEPGSDAAYLGTGRHGGGITLRLMFVKYEGQWLNVNTGKPAPFRAEEFEV